MTKKTYGIYNKNTRLWFSGFNENNIPVFSSIPKYINLKLHAKAQAFLLNIMESKTTVFTKGKL